MNHANVLMRRRRGVSHLLAIILGIALVVILGVILFAYSTGFFRASSQVANVVVEDHSLKVTADGSTAAFAVTVKNMGTVKANTITITEASGTVKDSAGNNLVVTINDLNPGKSDSAYISLNASTVNVGQQYLFIVQVTYADGSTDSFQFTVVAESF